MLPILSFLSIVDHNFVGVLITSASSSVYAWFCDFRDFCSNSTYDQTKDIGRGVIVHLDFSKTGRRKPNDGDYEIWYTRPYNLIRVFDEP